MSIVGSVIRDTCDNIESLIYYFIESFFIRKRIMLLHLSLVSLITCHIIFFAYVAYLLLPL